MYITLFLISHTIADYDELFAGNIDDHFRIGVGISKGTMKLYSKFYESDIILASPLGLRTVIGAEGCVYK